MGDQEAMADGIQNYSPSSPSDSEHCLGAESFHDRVGPQSNDRGMRFTHQPPSSLGEAAINLFYLRTYLSVYSAPSRLDSSQSTFSPVRRFHCSEPAFLQQTRRRILSDEARKRAATAAAKKSRNDWQSNRTHIFDTDDGKDSTAGASRDLMKPCQKHGFQQFYKFSKSIRQSNYRIKGRDRLAKFEIGPGDTVELRNGAFIQIDKVHDSRWQRTFSGHLFERNRRLKGLLPSTENEVFWLWTFPRDHPETAAPARIMAEESEVLRKWNLRKACPKTSHNNSPRDQKSACEQAENIPVSGGLICRWKYSTAVGWIDRADYHKEIGRKPMYYEKSFMAISASEAGKDSSVSRGDDSHVKKYAAEGLDNVKDNYLERHLTSTDRSSLAAKALPKYTYGDAFCGCGGMSRGAVMAGLNVKWGFDMDPMAIASYRRNFPSADAQNLWTNEFIALRPDAEFKVDVLHFSTPCQFFSIAHSRPGKDDVMNSSSLFTIPSILQKTDPRVVTLEQVPNIRNPKHSQFFTSLIQFFTWAGYSIRWKVINCVDFGVAQKHRVRLFLIASRTGTDLPKFPSPTHNAGPSSAGGRQPWTTVSDVLGKIPSECSENKLPEKRSRSKLWKKYNVNEPYPWVVSARDNGRLSCSNAEVPLTIREIGCFQSFPYKYEFEGKRGDKRRQIGNAVPPLVGQALLKSVKKWLMRTDGIDDSDDEDDDSDHSPDSNDPADSFEAGDSDDDCKSEYAPEFDRIPTPAVKQPLQTKPESEPPGEGASDSAHSTPVAIKSGKRTRSRLGVLSAFKEIGRFWGKREEDYHLLRQISTLFSNLTPTIFLL